MRLSKVIGSRTEAISESVEAVANIDSALALIERGANVSALDSDGDTPLAIACVGGYLKIIEALLKKGTKDDIFFKNRGLNLVHLAVMSSKSDCIQFVVNKGAQINEGKPWLFIISIYYIIYIYIYINCAAIYESIFIINKIMLSLVSLYSEGVGTILIFSF